MKILTTLLASGAIVALAACNPSTTGGPGTAASDSEKPTLGQTDNTFTLNSPMMATKLEQGETLTFSIDIDRGEDFNQDVTLVFDDVPAGLSITPKNPVIRSIDEKADVTITASDTASVGEFTLRIAGRPETGSEAATEMKVEISERDSQSASAEAWQKDRDDYVAAMREELAALEVQLQDLENRAADARGAEKEELDRQLAQAEERLDEASRSLDEMEDASPDRWETMKLRFADAMQDLKRMFV